MKLRMPIVGGAIALATTLAPNIGQASSHREAPFIAKNPKVDGTDFYAFMSYDPARLGYVTLLANYQGLQDGYGGPNFFNLDPDAIYEIHIDNTGDGIEDITFQFDFDTVLSLNGAGAKIPVPSPNGPMVAVPIVTLAAVGAGNEGGRNVLETYKVNVIRGPRRTGAVTTVQDLVGGVAQPFKKPLDFIGTKTMGDYPTYAQSFMRPFDVPGCTPTGIPLNSHGRVFVGQRLDGFAVNLGQIFDLVNLTPGPVAGSLVANILGAQDQNFNTLTDKNVTTIALEVPASCLVGASPKIGTWTTASVRQARVINPTGTFATPAKEGGPWVQVSRLGMPLVNEVVIGLPDKNKFNNSEPKDDAANFAQYITNPTLPALVEILYMAAGVKAPTKFPRTDLVTVFGQGVTGVTDNSGTTNVFEYIRLNTSVTTIFAPRLAAQQSPYGAAGCFTSPAAGDTTTVPTLNPALATCDATGFPNGRRPGDDVVDVSVRAAMGRLLNQGDAPFGQAPFVDGAANNAANFDATWPYLKTPIPGSP